MIEITFSGLLEFLADLRKPKNIKKWLRAFSRQLVYELRDEIRHKPINELDYKQFIYARIIAFTFLFLLPTAYFLLDYIDGAPVPTVLRYTTMLTIFPYGIAFALTFQNSRRKMLWSSWLISGSVAFGMTFFIAISDDVHHNNYYLFFPVFGVSLGPPLLQFRFYPILVILTVFALLVDFIAIPLFFDDNAWRQIGAFIAFGCVATVMLMFFIMVTDFNQTMAASFKRSKAQSAEIKQSHSLLDLALEQTKFGVICFDEGNRLLFTRGDIMAVGSGWLAGIIKRYPQISLEDFGRELKHLGVNFDQLSHGSQLFTINGQHYIASLEQNDAMTVFSVVDVSEQKQQELSAQNAQQLSVIGQLTSGIAHDYNNMLAIALANLEAIPRPKYKKLWREYLFPAIDAIELAKNVSRKLLTLSGRGDHEMVKVSISHLLNGMKPIFVAALQSDAALEIDIRDDGVVRADQGELENSLLNLVLNAKNAFGGKRGTIRITTERVKDEISISVEDNGPGVPKEIQEKIFEPFFTTRMGQYSTGLGLSMARSIIELAGGRIELDSNPGRTIFRIVLPLLKGEVISISDKTPSMEPRSAARLGRILVVDDNTQLLTSTTRLLCARGAQCHAAATPDEAREIVNDNNIDIALLDLTMPEMSGIELGCELLKIKPGLRCFIITGAANNAQMEGLTGAGFEGWIQKPVRVGELIERLSRDEALSA